MLINVFVVEISSQANMSEVSVLIIL